MNKKLASAAAAVGAASMMFSAVAMAQTPGITPGTTATASTSTTAVATGSAVSTGTVSGTARATAVGTGTAVGSGTAVPTIVVGGTIYQAGGTGNFAYADPAFRATWDRTDAPVKSGQVSRTYFWGPGPNTPGLIEAYKEGPGGLHLVQYFDKSRMEINNPQAARSDPFFVTNGLLTVDLIAGSIQEGNSSFANFHPACIPMSGDFGDTMAPTYASFEKVSVSRDRVDTHTSTDRTGQNVTATIDRNGNVGDDPSKANVQGVKLAGFVPQTKHNIPQAFLNFLNSTGPVQDANGKISNQPLNNPTFYVTGYPISEAYWAKAVIKGKVTDVMIQAYERRALTYVPSNTPGFQVEMANIGQHYFDWRYRNAGYCGNDPVGTPTPPVVGTPGPGGTAVATGTAHATGTVVTTPGATQSPSGTGTAVGTVTAVGTAVGTVTAVGTAVGTVTAVGTAVGTPSVSTTVTATR